MPRLCLHRQSPGNSSIVLLSSSLYSCPLSPLYEKKQCAGLGGRRNLPYRTVTPSSPQPNSNSLFFFSSTLTLLFPSFSLLIPSSLSSLFCILILIQTKKKPPKKKAPSLLCRDLRPLVPLFLHCYLPAFGASLLLQTRKRFWRCFFLLSSFALFLSAKFAIHINNPPSFQTFLSSDKDSHR